MINIIQKIEKNEIKNNIKFKPGDTIRIYKDGNKDITYKLFIIFR